MGRSSSTSWADGAHDEVLHRVVLLDDLVAEEDRPPRTTVEVAPDGPEDALRVIARLLSDTRREDRVLDVVHEPPTLPQRPEDPPEEALEVLDVVEGEVGEDEVVLVLRVVVVQDVLAAEVARSPARSLCTLGG